MWQKEKRLLRKVAKKITKELTVIVIKKTAVNRSSIRAVGFTGVMVRIGDDGFIKIIHRINGNFGELFQQ